LGVAIFNDFANAQVFAEQETKGFFTRH